MESWFLFALISALCAGLYSFSTKVSAHYNHHSAHVSIYTMVTATVLSGIYALIVTVDTRSLWLIFVIAVIDALAYLTVAMTRIDALKSMDAVLFFPLYKVTSSILAVPLGIFFFSDVLSGRNFLGIGAGLLVPLLLITNGEKKRQTNLRKGLLFLAVGVVGALIASAMGKMIRVLDLDIALYIFFASSLISLFAALVYKRDPNRSYNTKHVEWVGIPAGVFVFGNLLFVVHAFSGNLATVYLINSFSTVVVVLLSVLTFKEHLSLKKVAALVITVISLALLK